MLAEWVWVGGRVKGNTVDGITTVPLLPYGLPTSLRPLERSASGEETHLVLTSLLLLSVPLALFVLRVKTPC